MGPDVGPGQRRKPARWNSAWRADVRSNQFRLFGGPVLVGQPGRLGRIVGFAGHDRGRDL